MENYEEKENYIETQTEEMRDTADCDNNIKINWNDAMIKLLLQEVGVHIHLFGVQQHKTIWKSIVTAFNKKGYNINSVQCSNKWKSLKKRYKAIKDNNKQSGASKHYWVYFDAIDEILKKHPEIAPLSLASSIEGFKLYVDSEEEGANENNPEEISLHNNNPKMSKPTNIRKARKANEPYWAKQLRIQRERHHRENAEQKERLLSLLEKRYNQI